MDSTKDRSFSLDGWHDSGNIAMNCSYASIPDTSGNTTHINSSRVAFGYDLHRQTEPVRYDNDLRQFPTDLHLQADNPIAYAYTLLEQSGEFADATWNV